MVRVLIDRTYVDGMGDIFRLAIMGLRMAVSEAPGYISGETLKDVSNPNRHVVISSWRSQQDWENWYATLERMEKVKSLTAMLVEAEHITVLEHI